tara:strand:+ start:178 stop:618 length:441 start_codon:yes stop_codon:yes gene_type:complete
MESSVKASIRAMIVPATIMFSSTIAVAWIVDSKEAQEAMAKISEGGKAIAWHVTSPRCVVNDVCLYIEEDKEMGALVAIKETPSALADTFTTLITSKGEVTVEGKVHSLPLGENVKLYREFNGRENVLCVENACFDVPYDRNHTAY